MNHILLFFLFVVLLFQSGCANSPGLEEQLRQQQQEAQTMKESAAFARGLQQ